MARNGAGRTATRTLTYTVTRPPAISRLTITAGPTAADVARSGVTLKLTAATSRTRLAIELLARTPGTAGRAASQRSLARLPITVRAGSVALRLTLSGKAKQALRTHATDTLEIVIRGTSDRTKPASLRRSIILQGG